MQTTASDEQLLKDFAAGNRDALGELACRYEMPLLGLARGLLDGRGDLAMDAVQETWLRVIRFAGNFHGRSSIKTWLYRIAINQCHNLRTVQQPDPPQAGLERVSAATHSPEHAAQAAERNGVLQAAVAALDSDKGVVLLLCYHEGMSHEQAADILEIPLGTLKSRLHAALEQLRVRLASEDVS